jgi:hypothetical protein
MDRPSRLGRLALGFVASAGFATACAAITGVGDLHETSCPSCDGGGAGDGSSGDGGEGSTAADSGVDGGADATDATDGGAGVGVDIASAGSVSTATGLAQQTHLVYAQNGALWWLFYFDSKDPTLLKTRSSPDFATWSDGAALTLPYVHGNEGRDFSVAYASLGGTDLVHVTLSFIENGSNLHHFHARAVIAQGLITFDTPFELAATPNASTNGVDPDGPVTVVGTDGFVEDFSGFVFNVRGDGGGVGNESAWRSTRADTGGAWSESWGGLQLLEIVPNYANARGVLTQSAGGLVAFWENGSSEPHPDNIDFAFWTGAWSDAGPIGANLSQDSNDWTVTQDAAGMPHFVRRGLDDSFHIRRWMGGTWVGGASIPTDPGKTGSGIVLETIGSGTKTLYAIASDAADSVRATTTNGNSWVPWSTLVGSMAERSYLSGYASIASQKAALIWTETRGNGNVIVGTLTTP